MRPTATKLRDMSVPGTGHKFHAYTSQEAKLDLIIFNFIEQFVLLLDQLIFTAVQFNFMYKFYFYTVQLNCSEQFVLPLDQLIIIV